MNMLRRLLAVLLLAAVGPGCYAGSTLRKIDHPRRFERVDSVGYATAESNGWRALGVPDLTVLGTSKAGGVLISRETSPGQWEVVQQVLAPVPTAGSRFGESVAMADDLLAVGVTLDGTVEPQAGNIYIYSRNGDTWEFEQFVMPTDATEGDRFGAGVHIHNGAVIAPHRSGLLVWERIDGIWRETVPVVTTAVESSTLLRSDGTRLVVGNRNGTTLRFYERFFAAWREAGSLPGSVFSLEGDLLATRDRTDWGTVNVYRRAGDSFTPVAALESPLGDEDADFGQTMHVHGGDVFIGAPGAAVEGSTHTGTVFVFRETAGSWEVVQRIDQPSSNTLSDFGAEFGETGSDLLIGGYQTTFKWESYLRDESGTWQPMGKYPSYVYSAGSANFGWNVALEQGRGVAAHRWLDNFRGGISFLSREDGHWIASPPQIPAAAPYAAAEVLALDGSTVVAGQYRPFSGLGFPVVAYVYRWDGARWAEDGLLPLLPELTIRTGLAVEGDTIAVGGTMYATQPYPIYMFKRAMGVWTFDGPLVPPQGAVLGATLVLDEGRLFASGESSDRFSTTGSSWSDVGAQPVYVFRNAGGTWEVESTIFPVSTPGNALGRFGASVSVEGERVAISAPLAWSGSNPPVAFVFRSEGGEWIEEFSISLSPRSRRSAGEVELDGRRLVITDASEEPKLVAVLRVFGRVGSIWIETGNITPQPFPAVSSIALEGSSLLIGYSYVTDVATGSGQVFQYDFEPVPPTASASIADATQAGGDIVGGTFTAQDDPDGDGLAAAVLMVRPPDGEWRAVGALDIAAGEWSYAPTEGDGLYRFAVVPVDGAANIGHEPQGDDPGMVAVAYNSEQDSAFAYDAVTTGTLVFPMSDSEDVTLYFAEGSGGGPLSVHRRIGEGAPEGAASELFIGESLLVEGAFAGAAMVRWDVAPGSLEGLAEPPRHAVWYDAEGGFRGQLPVALEGDTVTFGPIIGPGAYYVGRGLDGVGVMAR